MESETMTCPLCGTAMNQHPKDDCIIRHYPFDKSDAMSTEPSTIPEEGLHRDYGKPGLAEALRRRAEELRGDKITPNRYPEYFEEAADALDAAASGHTALLSQIGVLKHDVREVAERLSIEGQLGGQSFSEVNSLRAKMDDCARTLFKALAALSRPLP